MKGKQFEFPRFFVAGLALMGCGYLAISLGQWRVPISRTRT